MALDKDTVLPLVIAALVGAGGGTGAGSLLMQHTHPEIIRTIKLVQYELELDTVVLRLDAMDRNDISPRDRQYKLFSSIQTDLVKRIKDLQP